MSAEPTRAAIIAYREEAMLLSIREYLQSEGWDLTYLGSMQVFEVIGDRRANYEVTFPMLAVRADD